MPVYKNHKGKPVIGYKGSELDYTDPVVAPIMFWFFKNSDGSKGEPLSLKQENEMLGRMSYQQAEKIRKQSFGSLLGEQEGGFGTSLRSAISQKTRAKVTGIKEKFDPMNLARAVGGKTGAAIYGKVFGRDQDSMERFAGVKKKRILTSDDLPQSGENSMTEVLGLIYRLMLRNDEDDKLQDQLSQNKKEEEESEEEDRNQQLIRALTGRKKEPTRKEKKAERRSERKKEKKEKKQEPKKVETQTTTKVPTETPGPTKAPGIFSKAKGLVPSIPTAAKIGTGAAIIGAGGLLMPSENVASVINKASDQVGVDRSLMYAIAKQESGFDPSAAAKTSSAKGLYQFIKGTWKNMVDKYGSTYPILRERGPEDPEANAIAGALFIKENSNYLIKNNIPVNATTIYAAHFLGAGGAKTLLSADPNRNAAELMPAAAKANQFIFYDKNNNNQPRTVQQVIDVLFQKVGQYQEKYNQALNTPSVPADKIDMASKENKDLKVKSNNGAAPVIINNNTNTQKNSNTPTNNQSIDDRSAYQKKAQG